MKLFISFDNKYPVSFNMLEMFFISVLTLTYCFVYLKIFNNENIIFIKFFIYFIVYSFFIYIFIINFDMWNKLDFNLRLLLIFSYLINFASLILIINLKSFYSPSDYIYQLLSKNKFCSKSIIIKNLKKRNLIKKRINDLIKQGLLKNQKTKLELTKFGNIFIFFFLYNKKILQY